MENLQSKNDDIGNLVRVLRYVEEPPNILLLDMSKIWRKRERERERERERVRV